MKKQLPLSAIVFLALACSAWAETYTVTTALDTVNVSDGVLSFREAIIAVNANVDAQGLFTTGQFIGGTDDRFMSSVAQGLRPAKFHEKF